MGSSSECSLSLRLLGPFHLSIAGQEVPIESWKSRKALSLLKYLATRYGEKVPGDVLIDFLWPDSEYEAAVHTLHTTMYLLRKTLRDHTPRHLACHNWIEFSNGLYWLDTSQKVFIDVKAFSELYRESEDLEKQILFAPSKLAWMRCNCIAAASCRKIFMQTGLRRLGKTAGLSTWNWCCVRADC